jgi:hypothetical protein
LKFTSYEKGLALYLINGGFVCVSGKGAIKFSGGLRVNGCFCITNGILSIIIDNRLQP